MKIEREPSERELGGEGWSGKDMKGRIIRKIATMGGNTWREWVNRMRNDGDGSDK